MNPISPLLLQCHHLKHSPGNSNSLQQLQILHFRGLPLVEVLKDDNLSIPHIADGKKDNFRPFPWATQAELNSQSMSTLIGKCVQIKEYRINVLSFLGVGRAGPTFKVAVLKPKSERGSLMALQYRQGREAIEPLARAAAIFKKMNENDPVPHTISMRAFGRLKTPREPMFGGFIDLPPWQSDNGKAMLMTLARGTPLNNVSFDADFDKTTFKKQMAEFAESMYGKALIHGGLASETIYWNPDSQEATIIGFRDAVDRHAQSSSVAQHQDALDEMAHFLGETFGDDGAQYISHANKGPDKLDACWKFPLLASGYEWRSTNIHAKRER